MYNIFRFVRRKGIVLITTMLLLTIIVMIATLLTMSAHNGLKLGRNYSDSEQAYYAAVSGLEYARSRIYFDPTWMQKAEPSTDALIMGDLIVKEGGYLVNGYIGGNESNSRSQFTIAFSKPTSSQSDSGMDYISQNNISRSQSEALKRKGGVFSTYKIVPDNKIYIIVRGTSNGIVRYAEACLSPGPESNFSSYSSVANTAINVGLSGANPSFIVDSMVNKPRMLRAVGNISVNSSAKNDGCFVIGSSGTAYAQNVSINKSKLSNSDTDRLRYGVNIDTDKCEETEKMLKVASENVNWDSLTADSVPGSSIAPGAYIYDIEGNEWYYYSNAKISETKKQGKTSEYFLDLNNKAHEYPLCTNSLFQGPAVTVKDRLKCDGDLFIGAVDSKDFIGKKTAVASKVARVSVVFDPKNGHTDAALEMNGDATAGNTLILEGEVSGTGKIFSRGNVYLQGGSFFDTKKNSGVSIYAEEDVNIVSAATTEYAELNQYIKDVLWPAFYKKYNGKFDSEEKAAEKLLDFKVDGQEKLSKKLKDLNLKEPEERVLFAQALVAKNSSLVGGGLGDTVNTTFSKIEFEPKGLQDLPNQKPIIVNENSLSVPFLGGVSGDFTLAADNPLYDPYVRAASKGYQWDSCVMQNDVNSYYMTVNKVDSVRYFSIGSETNTLSPSLLKVTEGGVEKQVEFIEVWITRQTNNEQRNPSDLFIYIPLDSNTSTAFVRLGIDKMVYSANSNLAGAYNYEMVFGVDVKHAGDGSSAVDLKSIFEKCKEPLGIVGLADMKTYGKQYNNIASIPDTTQYSSEFGTITPSEKAGLHNPFALFSGFKEALSKFKLTEKAMSSDGSVYDFAIRMEYDKPVVGSVPNPETIPEDPNGELRLELSETLNDSGLMGVNDTIIRGMIFTQNGNINADVSEGSLTVRGGIISCNGSINVNNAVAFNLIYDPDYMQFFYGYDGTVTSYLYRGTF